MGVTPVYGFPYPALTDPPDGPAQIQALAEAVEADLVVTDANIAAINAVAPTYAKGIIKYGRRDTHSSTANSSTAVGALRLDSISVAIGRAYVINVSCHPTSNVSTDVVRCEVRGSTTGTATTADSVLTSGQWFQSLGDAMTFRFVYIAGANATLSILLCIARFSGTGDVSFYGDGTRNTELWVEEMVVVSDTGVDV